MSLPDITHLQFLVLQILLDGERSGREVRQKLAENGVRKSGPAFYQLMARMEDAGYAKGRYDEQVIDGQMIRERRYEITGPGIRVHADTLHFYSRRSKTALDGGIAYA